MFNNLHFPWLSKPENIPWLSRVSVTRTNPVNYITLRYCSYNTETVWKRKDDGESYKIEEILLSNSHAVGFISSPTNWVVSFPYCGKWYQGCFVDFKYGVNLRTWCSSVIVLRSVCSRLFSFKATSLPLVISANSSSLESNCLLRLFISLSFRFPCSNAWLKVRYIKIN